MVRTTLKGQMLPEENIRYAVIIPAFNEEALLPATLAALRRAMALLTPRGEIIVVDNGSTDRTAQIALSHGARVVSEPFRQIARARNSGARAAKSEFLIFLDADTILPPLLLQQAISLLAEGTCCGGGTLLNFDTPLPFLADKLVRFWNWLSKTKRLAAGSFIFCLARPFAEIGGFDEKTFAGEELSLSRRLNAWGKKHFMSFTILAEHPVITSGRKFRWYSSLQIVLLLLLFGFFPPALRSRSLCRFWYSRPTE